MAKWTDMGHAMRRRVGAPANHLESAGASDDRNHYTSEEHYEMAKNADSPRIAQGDQHDDVMSTGQDADDYMGKAAPAAQGTLVPKQSTQSQDPTGYGAGNRQNIMYNERLGAAYRVSVPFTPTVDPVAGPTMQSAEIVPSVLGRQNPNFMDAANDQY